MKKKVFLNFWQALLLILCFIFISTIFEVGIMSLIKIYPNHSYLFETLHSIINLLIYVPFILFVAKKSNIKLLKYFSAPDISTLFRLIFIALLLQIIILNPLASPINFFDSLLNSKLRIMGSSIREVNLIYSIRMIIFIPLVEEVLFRGLILKQFLKQYSPIYSIILSSLLFSLYHTHPNNSVFLLVLGIILGIIYYKSNSILVTYITHVLVNMITLMKIDYFNLNPLNTVIYSFIYFISLLLVIFLLRKPIKTVKISTLLNLKGTTDPPTKE